MSNNRLLKENTIRRFMKLANVQSLTDNFIHEKYAYKADDGDENEDESPEELKEQEDLELEDEEAPEEDMEMDMEEEPEEDMDMEMDMEEDPEGDLGAADISLTEEEAQLLIDLGERLQGAMAGAGEEDMDMEEEPEEDMEMDMEEEPEEDMDMDMEDEEPGMGMDAAALQESRSEIINEVLKRVTKRIVSEKLRRHR